MFCLISYYPNNIIFLLVHINFHSKCNRHRRTVSAVSTLLQLLNKLQQPLIRGATGCRCPPGFLSDRMCRYHQPFISHHLLHLLCNLFPGDNLLLALPAPVLRPNTEPALHHRNCVGPDYLVTLKSNQSHYFFFFNRKYFHMACMFNCNINVVHILYKMWNYQHLSSDLHPLAMLTS